MKWKIGAIAVGLILSCFSSANGATAPHYAFSYAGSYPGAVQTYPNGVNLTLIVGYYVSTAPATLGYIQSGKKFITAEPPGSLSSYLFSINSSNIAVGGFCYPNDSGCGDLFSTHGYTYNYGTGATATIDYPGSMSTAAYGINGNGVIVGGFCPTRPACPIGLAFTADHGFIDDNGVFSQLDFPGATETTAFGINASGTIVGIYTNGTIQHSFIYQNAVYTDLNYPGANWTDATAINDLGVVVGFYQDATFNVNGFMYYKGQFAQINVQPSHSTGVSGINNHNDLVGTWNGPKGLLDTFKAIPKH
jgi:probable HAF family extracellular repeat protein